MARENRFVILMTEEEREAIEQLARQERLTASTLARRILLFEAQQKGIVVPKAKVFSRWKDDE